jgi:hypothetical protein
MHFRPRHLAALLALLTSTVAGPAAARRVGEVVATAAAQARFAVPAVATGTVTFQHDEMVDAVPVIMLAHRRTLRVEIRGVRALVRGSKALVYEHGTVQARRDLPIVGSNVLFEDLAIFAPPLLHYPQISDDAASGVVVTSAPRRPSVYELLVYTFMPDDGRRVGAKYYRYAVNNLIKRARWNDFTDVAGQRRPQTMVMNGVEDSSVTTITLEWRARPDLPHRLLTPDGLADPSNALFD